MEAETSAFKNAQTAFENRIPSTFYSGQPEYKYLDQMYKDYSKAKGFFYKEIEQFQKDNPTEKIIYDTKTLQITGIESGALGKSVPMDQYNKLIKEAEAQRATISSIPTQQLPGVSSRTIVTTPRFEVKKDVSASEFAAMGVPGALGAAGGTKGGGTIWLSPKASDRVTRHEIAHLTTSPLISTLSSKEEEKIAKEGRLALGVKYLDFFGTVGTKGEGYTTKEQYVSEGLAIAQSNLVAPGNFIKKTAIRTLMPTTVKVIEGQGRPDLLSIGVKEVKGAIPQRVSIGASPIATPTITEIKPTFKGFISDVKKSPGLITKPIELAEMGGAFIGRATEVGAESIGLSRVKLVMPEQQVPQKSTLLGFGTPNVRTNFVIPKQEIPLSRATGELVAPLSQIAAFGTGAGGILLASSAARGTRTLLSKQLSPMERIGGAIEAGTSGSFLGGGALRGLKAPKDIKIFNLEPKTESMFVSTPTTFKGQTFEQVLPITVRTTPRVMTYSTKGLESMNLFKTTLGKALPIPEPTIVPKPRYKMELEPRVDISVSPLTSISAEGEILGRLNVKTPKISFEPATVDVFKVPKTKDYSPAYKTYLISGKSDLLPTPKSFPEEALVSKTDVGIMPISKTSAIVEGKRTKTFDLVRGRFGMTLKGKPEFVRSIDIAKQYPIQGENIMGIKAYSYSRSISQKKGFIDIGAIERTKIQGVRLPSIDLGGNVKMIPKGRVKTTSSKVKLYHGTSSKYLDSILSKGIKPSKSTGVYQGIAEPLPFVSTGTSKETAMGFAARTTAKRGGKPIVLEIDIPKQRLRSLLVDSNKISGVGEVRLKQIPSNYIKQPETILSIPQKKAVTDIFAAQIKALPKIQSVRKVQTTQTPSRSVYYGKGLYEVSAGGRLPSESVVTQLSSLPKIKEKSLEKAFFSLSNVPKSSIRTESKEATKLSTGLLNQFRSAESVLQTPSSAQKSEQLMKLESLQKQLPRQRQDLLLTSKTMQKLMQVSQQTTRREKSPGLRYKPKTVYSDKGGKIVKASPERYIIFLKRFGKDTIIGEAYTLEEAKRILRSSLTSGLGRSGFIQTGTKQDRVKIDLGFGFRPSKKERTRVVQESWFSLGSTGERREIQSARKSKLNIFGSKPNNLRRIPKLKWF